MTSINPITCFRRAWTEPDGWKPGAKTPPQLPMIEHLLTIDVETTTDVAQALNFGCAQWHRITTDSVDGRRMAPPEEWLFYADDLPQRDPDGFDVLKRYAYDRDITLLSQRDFLDRVLWKAVSGRGLRATVCGYNLMFDLPRIAYGASARPSTSVSAGSVPLETAEKALSC